MNVWYNNKLYSFDIPGTRSGLLRWFKQYEPFDHRGKKIPWHTYEDKFLKATYVRKRIRMEDELDEKIKTKKEASFQEVQYEFGF